MVPLPKNMIHITISITDGNSFSIMFPTLREDLTAAEVQQVIDLIIHNNIFAPTSGELSIQHDIKDSRK